MRFFSTIFGKLYIFSLIILGASISIYGVYFYQQYYELVESNTVTNAKDLAKNLANYSADNILNEDIATLENSLCRVLESPDVLQITVWDSNGNLLNKAFKGVDGSVKTEYNIHHKLVEPAAFTKKLEDKIIVLEPIKLYKLIGYVEVIYSLDKLKKARSELIINSLIFAVFFVLVMLTITYWLLKNPIKEINTIANFAKDINSNKGKTIEIVSIAKEIDEIVLALNQASYELQKDEFQINEKRHQLEELNKHLELKVEEKIGKLREKDAMLIQQSRLAAIGEMLGNIAHQWRQPLNVLSLVIQTVGLKIYDTNNEDPELSNAVESGMEQLRYLSNTIDYFRTYFAPTDNVDSFELLECIETIQMMLLARHQDSNLTLVVTDNIRRKLFLRAYRSDFIQSIIAILTNSNEFAILRDIKNPEIKIDLSIIDTSVVITICDNCGGIKEELILKIFDPYFSTKNEKNRTGMGLYMAKMVIEKQMFGSIVVFNKNNGACTQITLQEYENESSS